MTDSTPPLSPSDRWSSALALGVLFSLGVLVLKIGIRFSEQRLAWHWGEALGLGFGAGTDLMLATLLGGALTYLQRPFVRNLLAGLVMAPVLLARIAASHYHAFFGHLPGRRAVAIAMQPGTLSTSIEGHASWTLAIIEIVVTVGLVLACWPSLSHWFRSRWPSRPVAMASILAACLLGTGFTHLGHGAVYHMGAQPVVHYLTSAAAAPQIAAALRPKDDSVPPPALVERVQSALGVPPPLAPADPRYPYCRATAPGLPHIPSRSVILLILEGVGTREAALRLNGQLLMPNLQRIAQQAVHFDRFYATGDRSSQGLVATMSGIPAATHRRILAHAPLPHLSGFPERLRKSGYHTLYLHGSDLSFEQQREYLSRVGFSKLVEPDPRSTARLGWGVPDGPMFGRLRDLLSAHRAESETPFLATFFTISTHDPYRIPAGEPTAVSGDKPFDRFRNALAYLDRELGRFYDWYAENERSRGTLLFITGDHNPRMQHPSDPGDTSTGEFEYRFGVPFIVDGLVPAERERALSYTGRPGGHHDIGPTLLGRLGVQDRQCLQGQDLLTDAAFPERRWLVSIAGEALELFYVHDGDKRWMVHLPSGRIRVFDTKSDPMFRKDLLPTHRADASLVHSFTRDYLALGSHLNLGDHFAPPPPERAKRVPAQRPKQPIVVAHRGNTRGPVAVREKTGGPPPENSRQALQAAVERGFEWAEIDLHITRDRVPVLYHDATVVLRAGREAQVDELTLVELRKAVPSHRVPTLKEVLQEFGSKLNFCLELKPQRDVFLGMDLVQQVLRQLQTLPPERRVIVDSFRRTMLTTIASFSPAEVGYDLPQKPVKDEWLDYAVSAGFDWVYARADLADADVIARARKRGLKVMLYTLDAPAQLKRFGAEIPDGIMTDHAASWL